MLLYEMGMEKINDKFLFEIFKIHEFKIKTLWTSCFLPNIFFLNFWKKHKNFMKIGWFCQKCKAMSFSIFYTKKMNRNRICHSENFHENQVNSWASKSQQARLILFFCIYISQSENESVFWRNIPKNISKTVLNWFKKYNQFEHVWMLYKQESTCMVVFINKGFYWYHVLKLCKTHE